MFFLFISYIENLVSSFSSIALSNLEFSSGDKEWCELIESIISRVKIWLLLLEKSTDISEKCPSIIISKIRDSVCYKIYDALSNCIDLWYWSFEFREWNDLFSFLRFLSFYRSFFCWLLQNLDIDEFVTGDDKRIGSFFLTDSIDLHPRLSESCRETSEVRVARHKTESIDFF